jgi:hypothetical protein
LLHDPIGHAAHQHTFQSALSMRGEHGHVDIFLLAQAAASAPSTELDCAILVGHLS